MVTPATSAAPLYTVVTLANYKIPMYAVDQGYSVAGGQNAAAAITASSQGTVADGTPVAAAAGDDEEVIDETGTRACTNSPFVYLGDDDDDERSLFSSRVWREGERERRHKQRERCAFADRRPASPVVSLSNRFSAALLAASITGAGQHQQGATSSTAASDVIVANLAKMGSSLNAHLKKEGWALTKGTLQLMGLYKALWMAKLDASVSSTTQDTSPRRRNSIT